MNHEDLLITVKSHEARIRMSEMLNSVMTGSHVLITRNGRRTAVMVDPKFYEEALAALTGHPTNPLNE